MKTIPCLLMLTASLLMACSQDKPLSSSNENKVSSLKTTHAEHTYQKPGATLNFDHTYDGKTVPGDTEKFELIVTPGSNYHNQTLKVNISTKDAINIRGDLQSTHLISGDAIRIPLEVSTSVAGRFYIDILGMVTDTDGISESRAYGIAIGVGNWKAMQKPHENLTTDSEGRPVIVMEAEEEIYN